MDDKNNNNDFRRITNTLEDIPIPSISSDIGDFYIFKNEYSKIIKSEILQSRSCCYSKLSSMDFELKNSHKRWSIID